MDKYYWAVLDLKAIGFSEQDRTLSYRKNIMVKLNQKEELYTKMGVCFTSAGVPSGHIKGRRKDKISLLPMKNLHLPAPRSRSITGQTDEEGHIAATGATTPSAAPSSRQLLWRTTIPSDSPQNTTTKISG